MNKVALLAATNRAELFAETASRLGLPDSLVEKDFWVCWMLAQLFSIEEFKGRLLFKGGTSLSKVFGAIARFSEDIDLAVDYAMLGFTGPTDPNSETLSRTKQQAILEEMLAACRAYIKGEFIDRLRARCREVLGPEAKGGWTLSVDVQSPDIVRLEYPRAVRQNVAYIVPQVQADLLSMCLGTISPRLPWHVSHRATGSTGQDSSAGLPGNGCHDLRRAATF